MNRLYACLAPLTPAARHVPSPLWSRRGIKLQPTRPSCITSIPTSVQSGQSIRCCHSASDQLIPLTDHIHLSLICHSRTNQVSHLLSGSGLETLQALWIRFSFWSVDCCMNELNVMTRPIDYLTLSALSGPSASTPVVSKQASDASSVKAFKVQSTLCRCITPTQA